MLKSREKTHHGRLYQLSENVFNRIISFYGETLKVVLRVQPLVLLVALGTLVAHHLSLHRNSEGPLPHPGHRR